MNGRTDEWAKPLPLRRYVNLWEGGKGPTRSTLTWSNLLFGTEKCRSLHICPAREDFRVCSPTWPPLVAYLTRLCSCKPGWCLRLPELWQLHRNCMRLHACEEITLKKSRGQSGFKMQDSFKIQEVYLSHTQTGCAVKWKSADSQQNVQHISQIERKVSEYPHYFQSLQQKKHEWKIWPANIQQGI